MEHVDVLIVGAGPVGLYGTYYAGFRGLSVAVMDSLPEVGGQVSALYPEKNIYDVAGLPGVRGQTLVDNLVEQAAPFRPQYLLGQRADTVEQAAGGKIVVTSSAGTRVSAGAVVVTGGIGSFSPRPLPCGREFEGRGLGYFVPKLHALRGLDVVVVGGGDSAVDWALALEEIASSVTLVHRRQAFRAHEHSVTQLRESSTRLVLDAQVVELRGGDHVREAVVSVKGQDAHLVLDARAVVAALGFTADLGPLESWGFTLDRRRITVDTAMRTGVPGVFAAGDIATYPGKVKLIAVGFGEVATAVNNAAALMQPDIGIEPGHSSETPSGLPVAV
ncbi:MAG: NAD(P)/FAD-dependent oxidoreductase [Thermocrispum sp.]